MYLLDSCTISDFMKGLEHTSQKIKSLSPSIIYTSTITQMEISYGLLRKFDASHRYFGIFDEFIAAITLLDFDSTAAFASANIKKDLEKQGRIIGAYDILIAGIAKANDLTLVTSNEKEFIRVKGMSLENWR
jgi:tRNA(fMet)-specific endonuclease VapC